MPISLPHGMLDCVPAMPCSCWKDADKVSGLPRNVVLNLCEYSGAVYLAGLVESPTRISSLAGSELPLG